MGFVDEDNWAAAKVWLTETGGIGTVDAERRHKRPDESADGQREANPKQKTESSVPFLTRCQRAH